MEFFMSNNYYNDNLMRYYLYYKILTIDGDVWIKYNY